MRPIRSMLIIFSFSSSMERAGGTGTMVCVWCITVTASLVSEQHNYFTQIASTQQLSLPHSRINIRKFCPTVIGKYYFCSQ